jgi:hypothetical protein
MEQYNAPRGRCCGAKVEFIWRIVYRYSKKVFFKAKKNECSPSILLLLHRATL